VRVVMMLQMMMGRTAACSAMDEKRRLITHYPLLD
jgi:hypothetical protein